jgi:hypothetical protein
MQSDPPVAHVLLEQIVQQYRQVDGQLEQLLAESARGEWSEAATKQVMHHLTTIQRLSAEAGEAAAQTPGSGRPTSELEQLTGLFQAMLAKIAHLEKAATEARDRLLPQVNAGVRSLQMQRAYASSPR